MSESIAKDVATSRDGLDIVNQQIKGTGLTLYDSVAGLLDLTERENREALRELALMSEPSRSILIEAINGAKR